MERTTPELSGATGLKAATSDRAKRLLLNLESAEADSLLTPAQEDCSWLHLFPIMFPHAPQASDCTVALSQKYRKPFAFREI